MDRDTFEVDGYEAIRKEAKPHGNGARVLVPKEWAGEEVKIIRATRNGHTSPSVEPIAALMHEAVANEDATLVEAMRKISRFQGFSDVDDIIAEDFRHALNSPNTRSALRKRTEQQENEERRQFYREIQETDNLEETLRRWAR